MADPDWRARGRAYGPLAALLTLLAFMVWVRVRPIGRVVTESDVRFSGNDPWYHARMVHYTVRYFPSTPNFDPWSYFPYGTGRHSGFGGLFDQLIALGALVVGLGSPSPRLVEVVTAYAPVVFGALTVIPLYFVAARLMDRWSALIPAALLAIVGGQFLTRTIIGVSDHQSAEALFGTLALFGFVYAMETAYREQPTRADLVDRNWRVLRRPTTAGVLGGIAIAAYLMMWGPGVFLVFTVGVFVVLQSVREHVNGESTEFLTFATVTSFVPAAVLTLLYAKSYTLEAAAFSLLQPLVLVGVAGGSAVLWFLSVQFRERGYDREYYPPSVAGLIFGSFGLAIAVHPPVLGMLESLVVTIYSFGLLTSPSALTVAEIAPATVGGAWRSYAGLFPLAIVGFLLLGYRVAREDRPLELLLLLWSLTITSAYFTMVRFGYYFGVTVALLAGFAVWRTAKAIDLDELETIDELETYQVLVVLIVIVAIVPGNVVAVGGTSQPAWETADGQGGSNTAWQNELAWLDGNTPEVPMDYYGRYDRPADGDFDYPDGAYGVMSWWDYGHWITYTGHRIPDANPFQQGPRPASAYLLSDAETRANLVLEALPAVESRSEIPEMSNEELRTTVESQPAAQTQEDTRYVMIDDQMAGGKFPAIATWTGPGPQQYFSNQQYSFPGQSQLTQGASVPASNDRYDATMLSRLYFDDARGLDHYRLVHETEQVSAVGQVVQNGRFQGRVSLPLQAGWTEGAGTTAAQLEQAEQASQAVQLGPGVYIYDARVASRVKTYERVPGATLTGQADVSNRTSVFAFVDLQTNTGRNFTYTNIVQTDEQGRFAITVPYATTNTVGPNEGGTDSGVIAISDYEVVVGNPLQPLARGSVGVPEPAVYDGQTIEVAVEPIERPNQDSSDTANETNASAGPIGTTVVDVNPTASTASIDTDPPAIALDGPPLAAEPRRALDG